MSDETGLANTSVDLNLGDLTATIAVELATKLSTPEEIRKRFSLTKPQWAALTQNKYFRGMVRESLKAWEGDMNAGRRITLKAEVMLEDSLKDLYGIIQDQSTPTGERVKAIQTMAELAGAGKTKADKGNSPQAGFTLNIQIGGDEKPVIIQASTNDPSNL